jgi:hypothetical protein
LALVESGNNELSESLSPSLTKAPILCDVSKGHLIITEAVVAVYRHAKEVLGERWSLVVEDAPRLVKVIESGDEETIASRVFVHRSARSEMADSEWLKRLSVKKVRLGSMLRIERFSEQEGSEELIGETDMDFKADDLILKAYTFEIREGEQQFGDLDLIWREGEWKIILFISGA